MLGYLPLVLALRLGQSLSPLAGTVLLFEVFNMLVRLKSVALRHRVHGIIIEHYMGGVALP